MPSPRLKRIFPFVRAGGVIVPAVTAADAELFEGSLSGNGEVTVAVLFTTVPTATDASMVATIEAPTVAPTASDEKVTVRLLPAPLHTPPGPSHETKVSPAGSASLNVTEGAVVPDLFVTLSR